MRGGKGLVVLALAMLTGCAGSESLRLSFDHSELHRPSFLVLDVPGGGFEATFRDGTHGIGRFSPEEMRQIRAALAAATAKGFGDKECLRTPLDERTSIVVSTGGRKWLDLHGGRIDLHAPADLTCWTAEATALHNLIDVLLKRRGDDWAMPPVAHEPGPIS